LLRSDAGSLMRATMAATVAAHASASMPAVSTRTGPGALGTSATGGGSAANGVPTAVSQDTPARRPTTRRGTIITDRPAVFPGSKTNGPEGQRSRAPGVGQLGFVVDRRGQCRPPGGPLLGARDLRRRRDADPDQPVPAPEPCHVGGTGQPGEQVARIVDDDGAGGQASGCGGGHGK